MRDVRSIWGNDHGWRRPRRLWLAVAVASGLCAIAQSDTVEIIRLVRSGDTPPNRPGELFTAFSNPCINNNGAVAFKGDFDGPASGNEGIYLYTDAAGLQRLVDDSFAFQPPGQGGSATWTGFGPPVLNNSDVTLFHANFSFGDNEHGLYVYDGAAVVRIFDDNPLQAVPGQVKPTPPFPPGGPGFTTFPFGASILPLLADNGTAVTTAQFRDDDLNEHNGMYVGASGATLQRVTDTTLSPPGDAGSARFSDLDVFTRTVMNGDGDVVFLASIAQGTSTTGLFQLDKTTMQLTRVVDDRSTPPGQAPGARFTSFDPVFSTNDAGEVAFAGSYVLGAGAAGVYLFHPARGTTTIVDTSGAFAVPGQPGALWTNVGEPVLNAGGDVVFAATFVSAGGANSGGVFIVRNGGTIETILKLGDPAPGQPDARFTGVGHRIVNSAGHVALTAQYIDGIGNEGVYIHDGFELRRVVDESEDLLDDVGTDFRMMVTVGAGGSGGQDSKPRTFNDADQLTFWARLVGGGEAIYRATVGVGCRADFSGPSGVADQIVDSEDLEELISAWGNCASPCLPRCPADLDGNCTVNVFDLLDLLRDWGECPE